MRLWKTNEITAVDLGQYNLKLVRLVKKGTVWCLAQEYTCYSPGIPSQDNFLELARCLREASEQVGINGSKVVSFIGGNQMVTHQLIMPHMSKQELHKALAWEAQKLMNVPVSELEVRPVVLERFNKRANRPGSLRVLLAVMHRPLAYRFYEIFDRANLVLTALDLSPLNLWRVFHNSYCNLKPVGVQTVVDIGQLSGHLIIIKEGALSYTKAFNLGQEWLTGPPKEFTPSGEVLRILSTEIRRAMELCRTQGQNAPERLVLTGGGSQVTSLPEYLEAELGLPVFVGRPRLTDGEGNPRDLPPSYSMVVGLALREVFR